MSVRLSACAAAALALGSAAVTAYWLLGGTALLDTVGGSLERLARSRSAASLVVAAGVVAAKVLAAVFALLLLRRPVRRIVWVLDTIAAAVLLVWGALNVLAGSLVLGGVLHADADRHALRWHVLLWDMWFLVWGAALAVALRSARREVRGA